MEVCRSRFETLVDAPVESERPLRVFAFGRRDAFDAFFRRVYMFTSNVDGMYLAWPTATVAMTTEFPAYRLVDPQRAARILLSYFYLDTYKRSDMPQWVRIGIANLLACGGDHDELGRLNRKLMASLSRGSALGAVELFHISRRTMTRLASNWEDHDQFAKYAQFPVQWWSVVEYLCGDRASDTSREQFRGFLSEVGPREPHEQTFERHFGYRYDALIDGWRGWVAGRGIGAHDLPPPHLRYALLECVLPLIRNRRANTTDRVQAVRELGRAGYCLGADALIELLDAGDAIPTSEVVWSLEAISGLALGPDARKWRSWFNQLPEEITGVADLARRS
jgi:hypothetical protein